MSAARLDLPETREALAAALQAYGYTLEVFPDPREPDVTQLVISGEGKASRQCGYIARYERAQRAAFRCILEAAQAGIKFGEC